MLLRLTSEGTVSLSCGSLSCPLLKSIQALLIDVASTDVVHARGRLAAATCALTFLARIPAGCAPEHLNTCQSSSAEGYMLDRGGCLDLRLPAHAAQETGKYIYRGLLCPYFLNLTLASLPMPWKWLRQSQWPPAHRSCRRLSTQRHGAGRGCIRKLW